MTRDDVYYLLIRRLAWLDALLTPEQKTQLDGDLWFVAQEIVRNIDRPRVPEGGPRIIGYTPLNPNAVIDAGGVHYWCIHLVPLNAACFRCYEITENHSVRPVTDHGNGVYTLLTVPLPEVST